MSEKKHVWEVIEITLRAQNKYDNPYMDVDVWANLEGPGFSKKVYGFWYGDDTFKIRVTATKAGEWSYTTGSNFDDTGLCGITDSFTAIDWTEKEKTENPCRRGMVVATPNGHAFMYSDGTPVYLTGDTEWALFTDRYKWYDDEQERQLGPSMGFKDILRWRINQGYNLVATLAALPAWQDDGYPAEIKLENGVYLRSGWRNPTPTPYNGVKEMRNEGGFPFVFPGKVPGYENVYPDVERVNPDYFKYMDRKMDWLNAHGVTVFLETLRRDSSTAMKEYYKWPDTYIRFVHYIFTRYQANNCVLSPIHYDWDQCSIPSEEYSEGANIFIEKYGHPPFGTLLGCNAHGTTLANFGHTDEAKWLTLHQIGNFDRVHEYYWFLTDIFRQTPPVPAINGEPYYPGNFFGTKQDQAPIPGDTEEASIRSRSSLYGSLLSGGLAGYIYGCEGMWEAGIEPEAKYKIWDALKYPSGDEVRYVRDFIGILQNRYMDLVPDAELMSPNKYGDPDGYSGWAYCASLPDRSELLVYMEAKTPEENVRGLKKCSRYEMRWFDPRSGKWMSETSVSEADRIGMMKLPEKPDLRDWGLYLKRI